jgi:hypothetical protein
MTIATITALGFENKVKNNIHNMDNKKFDRLVAESTRSSLMESQRIDEWGKIGGKLWNVGKNLWKGAKQSMGFGQKAAQAELNAVKRANELGTQMSKGIPLLPQQAKEMEKLRKMLPSSNPIGDVLNTSGRLMRLQRNANRWRMGAGMGAAALAGYGLGDRGSGNAPGAAMAGAGMDGTYPGTDMSGGTIGGMYSGGTYPGGDMGGMYPGGMYPGGGYGDGMYPSWMYPGGGYGDGFYDPDPNSLYAYMGGSPYGYGYDDMYGYGYGDPYGYGYGDPYGYGYGGAYDDGGMDPMMMYYMMNGGF